MRNCKLVREPLYRQVATRLARELATRYQPGDRLPSEAELARQFAVSILTLREALRSLAQDQLIERRHGSGTYVADRPAHGVVALVSEFTLWHLRRAPFFLRMLDQARAQLDAAGQPSQLYLSVHDWSPTARDPMLDTLIEDVRRQRVRGVVVLGQHWPARWIEEVRAAGVPIVGSAELYDRGLCDFGLGIADPLPLALPHLARHHCRRVAVMQWTSAWLGTAATVHDQTAASLRQHGMEVVEPWICMNANPNLPGAGWERFREIWSNHRLRPNGLIVADDILFQDVQLAIAEMRISVPADLRVVVQTNRTTELHTIFPIVRCELDTDRYATTLTEQLLNLICRRPLAQRRVTLPLRLLEEESDQEVAPSPSVEPTLVNPSV